MKDKVRWLPPPTHGTSEGKGIPERKTGVQELGGAMEPGTTNYCLRLDPGKGVGWSLVRSKAESKAMSQLRASVMKANQITGFLEREE